MKNKNLTLIFIVIVIILGGGFIYAKTKSKSIQTTTNNNQMMQAAPTTSNTIQETNQPSGNMESQKITVQGDEFKFTPMTLTVKKGQPVELTFKNVGHYGHNLTISDLNIQSKTIQPGEQDTITFTPDKTGQFTYFCSVDSHEQKGMKGTLTVE